MCIANNLNIGHVVLPVRDLPITIKLPPLEITYFSYSVDLILHSSIDVKKSNDVKKSIIFVAN